MGEVVIVMLENYIQKLKNAELILASRKGNTKAVKRLISLGADVDAVNRYGYPPMLSFLKGHDDTVAALIAGGSSHWQVEKGRAKYTSTRSKL